MGDEIDIREDIEQLVRDVAAPRDAAIAELRAENAAIKEENAQLLALASRLSSVEMFENICPIALPRDEGARDEGAHAKRARDEDVREEEECVVQCGEDGGEKVGLPNCSHFIHLDCLMLMVAIAKRARCPFCNRPLAKSGDAQEKLAALEAAEAIRAQQASDSELAETLEEDDGVEIVEVRQARELADMNAIMDSDDEDNRPINPNV